MEGGGVVCLYTSWYVYMNRDIETKNNEKKTAIQGQYCSTTVARLPTVLMRTWPRNAVPIFRIQIFEIRPCPWYVSGGVHTPI